MAPRTQPRTQPRTLKTRSTLVDAARAEVAQHGWSGLRVDRVVRRAGVAKGTFFAHFSDKDGLLAQLVGERLDQVLGQMEKRDPPADAAELATALAPVIAVLTEDRIVFDIAVRYAGGMGPAGDARIAENAARQVALLTAWISVAAARGRMRNDQPADLLAEGVQAFVAQILGLYFCAEADPRTLDRLPQFLGAWLEA